jgi:hypothetical protein
MKRFVSAVIASSMALTSMAVNTSAASADEIVDDVADDESADVEDSDVETLEDVTVGIGELPVEVKESATKITFDEALTGKFKVEVLFDYDVPIGSGAFCYFEDESGATDLGLRASAYGKEDNTLTVGIGNSSVLSSDTLTLKGDNDENSVEFDVDTTTGDVTVTINGSKITQNIESIVGKSFKDIKFNMKKDKNEPPTYRVLNVSEINVDVEDSGSSDTTTEATTAEATTEATTAEATTEATTEAVTPVSGAVNVSTKLFDKDGNEITEALPGDTVVAKYYISGLSEVKNTFNDGSTNTGFSAATLFVKFDPSVLEYVAPVSVPKSESVVFDASTEYEESTKLVVSPTLINTQSQLVPDPTNNQDQIQYVDLAGVAIDGVKTAAELGAIKFAVVAPSKGGSAVADKLGYASNDGVLLAVEYKVVGEVGSTAVTNLLSGIPSTNGFSATGRIVDGEQNSALPATFASGSIKIVSELTTTTEETTEATTSEVTTEGTTSKEDSTETTTSASSDATETTTVKEDSTETTTVDEEEDVTVVNEEKSVSVSVGNTLELYGKVLSDISAKDYTWASSDTKYVTVSSKGVIKGVKKGTAVVTATYSDDNYDLTYTFNVTIKSGSSSGSGSSSSHSSGSSASVNGSGSSTTTGGSGSSSSSNGSSSSTNSTGSSSVASGYSIVGGKSFTTSNGVKITPPALADKSGNVYAGSAISGSQFSGNATYNDTSATPWAVNSIKKLASLGIVSGTGNGNFSPMLSTKRGDFILMLVNTLGLEGKASDNFDDVDPAKYYANAIGLAKEAGIATGYGNNTFGPDNYITRQDVMVLVSKTLEFLGDTDMASESVLNQFADKNNISAYAVPYVANLVSRGIVNGTDTGIEPKANITRAQMAVLIANVYDAVVEMAEAANPTVEETTEETTEAEEDTTVSAEDEDSTEETTEKADEDSTEETTEETTEE